MLVMYHVVVVKQQMYVLNIGRDRSSNTKLSFKIYTIIVCVYSSHSNLQRTRKAVRRLITLRLTFLRSNRQNDSANARSLLDVINNKRIIEWTFSS